MFNTIYIVQWDNYYDRRIHPSYSDLNDTLNTYLEKTTAVFSGINFVPNDYVNTTLVLNLEEGTFGNYLLVVNDENQITSRWFIIDTVRTRGGQYQVTLRRDLITDYWNVIKQAPALIEKCNLDFDNPLIFNNEDMTVNQIKTKETLLKDKSGCPWLVAYIAKDAPADKLSGTAKVGSDLSAAAISLGATQEDWERDNSTYYGTTKAVGYRIYYKLATGDPRKNYLLINGNSGESSWGKGEDNRYTNNTSLKERDQAILTFTDPTERAIKKGVNAVGINNLLNLVPAYATDGHSEDDVKEFLELGGKTVVDTDGKYFQVDITEVASETKVYDIPSGSLFNQLSNVLNNATFKYFNKTYTLCSGTPNEYSFRLEVVYNTYKATLKPLVNLQINYSVSTARVATEDAPYDILAIPYGRIYAGTVEGEGTIDTNAEIGLAVMQALAKKLDAACYDIQLVPYCPLQNYIVQSKTIITWGTEGMNHYITQTDDKGNVTKLGVIYSVPNANFNFNLLDYVDCAKDAIQRKVNNDCDKWRICSPNYSNYFDFSVEKNNGVDYFNVDCTYKPYSPYIHINPNFNGLYGQDFNDPRGLVCGGDYSLSQVRDAWESYQLQNKNFQETFDRQIQNMEFNNKYARIQEHVTATVGTAQGALAGATAGMVASGGNPMGAAIGGGFGGVASLAGGIADLAINEKLRNEAMDYTRDLFGYNLGNIQAIPLTLSKVSAFNQNNKLFPVLEYYTCTDTEKEAYANKIAYNGMTTMVIGKIEDNLRTWEYTINNKTIKSQNYIKAQIINLNIADGSSQVARAIADEVYRGFYIVEE